MRGTPGERDGENEAFIVDRYLESLLARRPADDVDLPPELGSTAGALAAGLPRYHPSFRFEEAVAARLAAVARVTPDRTATGQTADLIPFPSTVPAAGAAGAAGPAGAAGVAPEGRPVGMRPRPAVIGGVITSAAISLAGAAYVAWRRSHPPAHPMARAIRAAARRRTA